MFTFADVKSPWVVAKRNRIWDFMQILSSSIENMLFLFWINQFRFRFV